MAWRRYVNEGSVGAEAKGGGLTSGGRSSAGAARPPEINNKK
jgi:hypothetical protein